jgi:hypothetical protein
MMLAQGCNNTSMNEQTFQIDTMTHTTLQESKDFSQTETLCFGMQTQPAGMHANHNTCTTARHYTGTHGLPSKACMQWQ